MIGVEWWSGIVFDYELCVFGGWLVVQFCCYVQCEVDVCCYVVIVYEVVVVVFDEVVGNGNCVVFGQFVDECLMVCVVFVFEYVCCGEYE